MACVERYKNLYLFVQQKKPLIQRLFLVRALKKATALCGRSPLDVVWFTLGAGLDLLEHLGNKLVNAHLNGLVGAIADGDVAGLDLLLA